MLIKNVKFAMFNMLEYLGNKPVETSIVGLCITIMSRVMYKFTYYMPILSIEVGYIKDWVYIISAGMGGLLSLLGIIGWFMNNIKRNKTRKDA
jgi:uncharacterized MAPEG superfamily protein